MVDVIARTPEGFRLAAPADPDGAVILFGNGAIGGAVATRFLEPGYTRDSALLRPTALRVPRPGRLRNMRLSVAAPAASAFSDTYTLLVDGIAPAGGPVLTVPSGAGTGVDLVGAVDVLPTNALTMRWTTSGGHGSIFGVVLALELE